jgi:hypothetical protein
MGGKAKAPPPPDYGPIAAASAESAKYAFQLGREQLDWARDQYAQDKQTTDKVVDSYMRSQDANQNAAEGDRARYEQIYQPLEDQLVSDASQYASGERRDQDMGRAAATVAQQFQQQRTAAAQQLESFGVDPSSTRFAALDLGTRVQQAAAQAGAANQANQMTEATGRALRSEAINVGRGYPGQVAGTYNTALASGQGAVNSTLQQTASGASTMGTGMQWQGAGNQALGVWGNTLNMGYQNQLDAWKAKNSQSSGIGSALGLIGGIASGFMFEEGGAIPVEASPSRGAVVDDVPATMPNGEPARLNAGEFILPADVVAWKGQEWAQKEIQKARDEQSKAVAKPKRTSVPVTGTGGALPV